MKKQSNLPPPTIIKEQRGCNVTFSELKKVFTEWDKRYREGSEQFMSETEHLTEETPESYGDTSASYFMKLIEEIKG